MIVALQRFPIGQRVVALALLPLLVLSALATTDLRRLDDTRRDAATVVALTRLADQVGRVVHALQRERGATSLYVSSRGSSFGTELTGYRGDADAELDALTRLLQEAGAALPRDVAAAADDALSGLDGLAGVRSDADRFAAAADLIPAYTAAIGGLLAAMPVIVAATADADAARGLAALAALIVAKERAGIERAQLANVFTTRAFAPGQLVTVAGLVAARQEALGTFADLAAADQRAAMAAVGASAAFADATRLEEAALAGDPGALEVDPKAWFAAATARIDALMDLERMVGSDVQRTAVGNAAAATRAMFVAGALVGLALLVTVGLALAIAASIRRPLRRTVHALEALARGELDSELEVTARAKDEIAAMGRATVTATRSLREVLLRTVDTAQALAAAATELDQVSAEVSCGVETSTADAATVGGSAAQVSEAVDSVATATEQMGAAVQEIARHANQAASVASRAAGVAREATTSMGALRESSDRIEAVVRAVAQIAEQTNLLALNATIEAARAGEAGKGFAVVAGEVKELAHETSSATEDVTARVAALRADAASAADAITRIASIVGEIDDSQAQIAAAVEEQSVVTSSIAQHASSAAGSSDAIARGAQRVADTASRQGQSLTGLGGAAHDLARLAADLETGLASFRL